jgi:hypothetical protein
MKQIVRLPIIIVLGLVAGVFLFAEDSPASIHITLPKDTFALAEPTVLTIEISNDSDTNLIFSNYITPTSSFDLVWSPNITYTLVTPDGQTWTCPRGSMASISLSAPPKDNLILLPPGKAISKIEFLRWNLFLPSQYMAGFKKLPSGTYKLIAAFTLPRQSPPLSVDSLLRIYDLFLKGELSEADLKMEELHTCYETVEFVFLPEDKTSRITRASYICRAFNPDWHWQERLSRLRLQALVDSSTPYCEAARYMLVNKAGGDSKQTERSRFDSLYPGSLFSLLWTQQELAMLDIAVKYCGMEQSEAIRLADSMLETTTGLPGNNYYLLKAYGKLNVISSGDLWGENH